MHFRGTSEPTQRNLLHAWVTGYEHTMGAEPLTQPGLRWFHPAEDEIESVEISVA